MTSKKQSRNNKRGSTSHSSPRGSSTTTHAKQRKSSVAVADRGDTVLSQVEKREGTPKETGAEARPVSSAPPKKEAVAKEQAHAVNTLPAPRRSLLPTREQFWSWAPFWGVFLLGAILRFWGLGDKPLHHDESLHAYFSMQLMHNLENWQACFNPMTPCYHYDPILHGPFQFHIIALVYKVSQILGAPDHGINTTTVRIAAATLGTVIVALPFFLRDYLGKVGAWLACFLLAVSPSMVYFSRFAREDIYMACFTMLLVVATARYVRSRKGLWLVIAAAAFTLSYATKEATFLSIAVFGSFLGGLIAWELGLKLPFRRLFHSDASYTRYLPKTAAPVSLLLYLIILGVAAKILFAKMKDLSTYINNNTNAANVYVAHLKEQTLAILPYLGILIGLYVLSILVREMLGWLPQGERRRGLAAFVDPERQPTLDTIVTMPWTHWFFALLLGIAIFVLLFSVLFTNLKGGIGDGIWQGLYYWLGQQQAARGEQPWYYYLLLIPLYEQIGLIFGIIGCVRCLLHPSRFRLFLVFWFVGNFFIYSWAGEKMPWLMIHMTMPMMLLAAIGLEPLALKLYALFEDWRVRAGFRSAPTSQQQFGTVPMSRPRAVLGRVANIGAIPALLVTLFLLVLTLQNMFQVTYVHPADAPHEMMIYVQTTPDVHTVMAKVDALDQKYYGGKHLLPIGVNGDAVWPMYWYLRDYTNVCYSFPSPCSTPNPAVIISGGSYTYTTQAQYAVSTTKGQPAQYLFHHYMLRTWWDEGYKPLPCVGTKANPCVDPPISTGFGLFQWLSYGDNPPPHAQFDFGRAASNIWQWWWQRKAIGNTNGGTDMGFFIRKDLGMTP